MSGGVDGRLTEAQIRGLETWLAHVDPDDPVIMPQLVIDAMQALIEEAREWRAGALGAADIETLQAIRLVTAQPARGMAGIVDRAARLALIDRLLTAHGAKP